MPIRGRANTTVLLLFLLLPALVAGEEVARATPSRIEAAFLRNFAHYVAWPPQAFADEHAPWRICVLGGDPFGDVLDDTFNGRAEQGRSFVIVRTDNLADLSSCHVAYVAHRGSDSRHAALAGLANRPVLTVGDAPAFLQEGGIIRFQVTDHVEFAVNLDRANAASLKIPTKMLEVAHEIIENGVVRRRR
jgi:hypothetical protein